ncbi:MAG: methyltransferase domain-containing protein [Bacteroidota bacterium]|nr:methyltransferase domain-containing protein [Bacteroidota bacterium]MDP4228874.1 methyltransferase domain-containing protein [Bacteroidota bacterium]MDP4234961.1 methyltransferase domain-containing protein [Bacteroidota bacterium]
MNVTERFSDRVENYIRYRPHYPIEVIPFLAEETGLSPSSIIADIGSGTGISTEMFLKNGNVVYAVEPNSAMRLAAESQLDRFPNFRSINATAEDTMLADDSIDYIVAGQAFHWFDVERSSIEFRRILRRNGWVVLLWNNRDTVASPFLVEYEDLLNTYGTDYKEVNHVNAGEGIKQLFGDTGFKLQLFLNSQAFDFEGLKGRLLSSSYTPAPSDPRFQPMLEDLQRIYAKHNEGDRVRIEYSTELYYGRLG